MDHRLQRIAEIFYDVNRTHFDGVIPEPHFRLNTRTTQTAGWAWIDQRWSMEISVQYHDHFGWEEELVDTVKHETVHLYLAHTHRPSWHTREFKAIAASLGVSRWAKTMPRRRPLSERPRYLYLLKCPRCRSLRYKRSWKPGAACGACCDRYNRGQYSAEFALTLVRRETVAPITSVPPTIVPPTPVPVIHPVPPQYTTQLALF